MSYTHQLHPQSPLHVLEQQWASTLTAQGKEQPGITYYIIIFKYSTHREFLYSFQFALRYEALPLYVSSCLPSLCYLVVDFCVWTLPNIWIYPRWTVFGHAALWIDATWIFSDILSMPRWSLPVFKLRFLDSD